MNVNMKILQILRKIEKIKFSVLLLTNLQSSLKNFDFFPQIFGWIISYSNTWPFTLNLCIFDYTVFLVSGAGFAKMH